MLNEEMALCKRLRGGVNSLRAPVLEAFSLFEKRRAWQKSELYRSQVPAGRSHSQREPLAGEF